MKKTLSLLIIAIIALTSSINANAWTDRNTFNLKGPVKSVQDKFNYEFLEFEENGDIIFEGDPHIFGGTIDRDSRSRITYMAGEQFTYNSKGQVIKIIENTPSGPNTYKYIYNSKGQVIKEVSADAEDEYRITTTYTYQKFDSYGNWIKRTAKNKYGTKVETRTITYYE